MIAANELRIGNAIIIGGKHINVSLVSDGDSVGFIDGETITCLPSKHFKPIPLTEEWLVKFGGEKESSFFRFGGYFYFDKKLFIEEILGEEVLANTDESKQYSGYHYFQVNQSEIKYVHQLQNLYFALTGEELQLKL